MDSLFAHYEYLSRHIGFQTNIIRHLPFSCCTDMCATQIQVEVEFWGPEMPLETSALVPVVHGQNKLVLL